jgi:hypothetical protein
MRSRYLRLAFFGLAFSFQALSADASANIERGMSGSLEGVKPSLHIVREKAGGYTSGTWSDVKSPFPGMDGPDTSLLLTDGRVIMHDWCTSDWFALTPDVKGKYETGTWSAVAPMPAGYYPMYFASQILPDGRLIMSGGEFNYQNGNCGNPTWTAQGAIYDPVANSWTSVSAPAGWNAIGNVPSAILANGNYMLADCCTAEDAVGVVNGETVLWSSTGGGKGDDNEGEAWTLLPNGNVLTVDVNRNLGNNPNTVEIYNPTTGDWSSPGTTAQELVDPTTHAIGSAVLRPDGYLFYFGATSNIDVFNSFTGVWSIAPGLPYEVCSDCPAALLGDGDVLVQTSSGASQAPSFFLEYGISRKGRASGFGVNAPASAAYVAAYEGRFLELPTGQILWSNDGQTHHPEVATYTPSRNSPPQWRPVISNVATVLTRGSTGNPFSGTQFNGFSQGASYGGSNAQEATNYPLVRVTNSKTKDVCFGRTYGFSTMGVWTAGTTSAEFDLPASCEAGSSRFQVIVNGIASTAVKVRVQ